MTAVDHELLEVNFRSTRTLRSADRVGQESVHETYTRVSLTESGRIGSAYAAGSPAEVDLDELTHVAAGALFSTDAGVRENGDADPVSAPTALPTPLGLHGLGWLQPGALTCSTLDVHVHDLGSARLRSTRREAWQEFGLAGFPIARLPPEAPLEALAQPAVDETVWLVPPYAMSSLLVQHLEQALCGVRELAYWPRAAIADPAWHNGVDLEGTARRPMLFAQGHRRRGTATDLASAYRTGCRPTGHAGLAGPRIHDLVIGCDLNAVGMSRGAVVVQADLLACDPDGSGATVIVQQLDDQGASVQPRIVRLRHLFELLDRGEWCGPWQRGLGPWISRWFVMEAM
jgi:hypothetical protein